MCSKKDQEEVVESPDHQAMNNIQNYQNDLFFHQLISHQHQEPSQHETFGAPSNNNNNNIGSGFNIFSQDSPLWPSIDPLSSSSSQASFYGSFFNRTRSLHQHQQGLHLGYEGFHGATSASHQEQFRILSEAMGPVNVQTGLGSFGLQGEIGMMKMTAQEIMDAKALAASKSHSESERRRRERINNHLAKLRSILPNTTKTDKASLLAEVIQHVKELKKETSLISETNLVPTEYDELTVALTEEEQTVNGKFVIKATVCCEDRLNLLQDMVKTLKALGLKTLKAEITTVSGRVKNVLFVTGDENSGEEETVEEYCVETIEEALKVVMENKSNVEETSSSGNVKRQRMSHNNTIIIVDQQQQHM